MDLETFITELLESQGGVIGLLGFGMLGIVSWIWGIWKGQTTQGLRLNQMESNLSEMAKLNKNTIESISRNNATIKALGEDVKKIDEEVAADRRENTNAHERIYRTIAQPQKQLNE